MKMNSIKNFSLAAILVACTSLQAKTTHINYLKKIENLQKQINSLQLKLKKLSSQQSEFEDTSDELEDRVDQIETLALVDKINFNLEFRTRVDNFTQTKVNGNQRTKASDHNLWSNRLRLDMSSKISDNLKFNGRLTMYKNWSDSNINIFSGMDPMQGRRPSDSRLYVERSYVDWKVYDAKVPLILTIGRQPSSDGPSYQFKDNTVRKSTYSALSFDGAADGIVATFPLGKVTGDNKMALRIGYGKGYQDSSRTSYIGNPNGIKDTNVLGLFFDSSLGLEGSLFQFSAVKAKDAVSNTTDKNGASTNTNIGDIYLYTSMFEFRNIKNTNLDLFAHYAISKSKPNGKTANLGVDTDGDGIADADYPMGLLTNTSGDTATKTGHAYWVGARYKLPIKSLKNPYIGIEYNHGSKNWFSFTQGSNDVTNKLATRGSATEVYYIQPINRNAYLRLGAEYIKYDYTGSGYQIGAPRKISSANSPQLEKLKKVYLLFNVRY